MKHLKKAWASALGASFVAGTALAVDALHPIGAALPTADRTFLESAVQGSRTGLAGSRAAQERSDNPDVQAFAAAMIQGHSAVIEEASSLAARKGYRAPKEPSLVQKGELEALASLSGTAFDAMYIERLGIAAHAATIKQFQEAARTARDPEVKALAQKTLPRLEQQLNMARALDSKQKSGS